MSGFALEVALHWVSAAAYIAGFVAVAFACVVQRPRAGGAGWWLLLAGLAPHTLALALRWNATGHGPYMMRYEVLSANAWVAVAGLVVVLRRRPQWSPLALFVAPVAVLLVALAVFSNAEIRELPPTFESVWLVFHIAFAKLAAVSFLLSVAAAALLIARGARVSWRVLARAPADTVLDALVVRFAGFGLLFWSVTIAAGAIWANQSWGRYWGWDAIETWSLVSWLIYGALLHARLFFRVSPVRTAWLSIGAFALFVGTVLIFPLLLPSIHAAYFQ